VMYNSNREVHKGQAERKDWLSGASGKNAPKDTEQAHPKAVQISQQTPR